MAGVGRPYRGCVSRFVGMYFVSEEEYKSS